MAGADGAGLAGSGCAPGSAGRMALKGRAFCMAGGTWWFWREMHGAAGCGGVLGSHVILRSRSCHQVCVCVCVAGVAVIIAALGSGSAS